MWWNNQLENEFIVKEMIAGSFIISKLIGFCELARNQSSDPPLWISKGVISIRLFTGNHLEL